MSYTKYSQVILLYKKKNRPTLLQSGSVLFTGQLFQVSAADIAKLCNISLEAATYRAERMQELERRNAWYLHPLEHKVREQFDDFIKSKIRKKK